MSHDTDIPRPQTTFVTSIELDEEEGRALLLRPETPVAVGRSASGQRFAFARVGLIVATITGLCLVPAASLAEKTAKPVPPDLCQDDGTPGAGGTSNGEPCPSPPPLTPEPVDPDPPALTPEPAVSVPEEPASKPADPAVGDPAPKPADPAVGDPAPAAQQAQPAPSPGGQSGTGAAQAHAPATTKAPSTASSAPAPDGKNAASVPGSERTAPGKRSSTSRTTGGVAGRVRLSTRRTRGGAAGLRSGGTAAGVEASGSPGAGALFSRLPSSPGAAPVFVNDDPVIPGFLIGLYKEAGRRYDIPWTILAAINEIETDFGRNVAVSSAGAEGWMQFTPATWRTYGVDADGNGVKNPASPRDAIFAAARYLRASGAPGDMRRAIFAYNHAGWYVDSVLARAGRIAAFQGDRSGTVDKLISSGDQRLTDQVLGDPRISLYACGREDIAAGRIDRRVLVVLRFLAWSGLHPTVSSLECGHGRLTGAGNVSAHSYGSAVDIAAINGVSILGHQGPGSVTDTTIRKLLTLGGSMAPAQIISLMTYDDADNTLAMSDHADHIHVGFRALADPGD